MSIISEKAIALLSEAYDGVVGISEEGRVCGGYDQQFYTGGEVEYGDAAENDTVVGAWPPEDRRALADVMVERWNRWARDGEAPRGG